MIDSLQTSLAFEVNRCHDLFNVYKHARAIVCRTLIHCMMQCMCVHVAIDAEHDCGGGNKECVVCPQNRLLFGKVDKDGRVTSVF